MNLLEAWRLWGQGSQLESATLWGLSLLWWGRIGKLLQFAGALTVVLDLIGPGPLRRAGELLRKWPLRNLVTTPVVLLVTFILAFYVGDEIGGRINRWIDRLEWLELVLWGLMVLLGLSYGLLRWAQTRFHERIERVARGGLWTAGGLLAFVALILLLSSFGPIVMAAAALFFSLWLVGLLIDILILRPVIWVLDRDPPGHPVKWAGFILLVVGFHFDLLAS